MLVNNQNRQFKLRVFYKKQNSAIWISHLELLRTLQYIVRRSNLSYCVTNGFSPHMKISFSPALAVGIESHTEAFDIYLNEYTKPEICLENLQNASNNDIYPYEVKYVDNKDTLAVKPGSVTNYIVDVDCQIAKLIVPQNIQIVKKGKIKNLETKNYLDENLDLSCKNDVSTIKFGLKYTENGTMKPEVFVRELLDVSGAKSAKIIKFIKL